MLTVSCPACGFSRQLPAEKVPDGPRRVTCPRCKELFIYTKPGSPPEADDASVVAASEGLASSQPTGPSLSPDAPSDSTEFTGILSDSEACSAAEDGLPCPPAATEMSDIGELFRQSWELFQKRFAPLVLLYLLTIAAVIVPVALTVGASFFIGLIAGVTASFVLVPLGVLAGIIVALWCYGAFLCAVVDDTLTVEKALSRGKSLILPFAWVFLLSGFIVVGGYLLFIIPGIIFTVWFFSAQFLLPAEGLRGMEALLKSREYLRGQWWNVALRLLLIWTASLVVGAVPFFGPLLSFIVFPFVMIFHYLIYRDLRALKGDFSCPGGTKNKLLWPGVALLGWILVPALLILLFGALFYGKLRQSPAVEVLLAPGAVQQKGPSVRADRRYPVASFHANGYHW
ncbi:MAG: hypothetical protein EG824_08775 [Deltaproteobacteria bacterium]|nr:hypothetical protein [Deltaproteobacteria bacterium]